MSRFADDIGFLAITTGADMQRIAVCRAGGGYRLCFRVDVGVVDLLCNGFSGPKAIQIVAVGNVGALILLPAACAIQRPSAK